MSNKSWFYVITRNKNGWGSVTIISQDNCYWLNTLNGDSWSGWVRVANANDIINLRNQIQQLKDNQFEVQTFTDATAAANWEAQRPGKRMAIVNS